MNETIGGAPAHDRVAAAYAELEGRENVTVLTRTTVYGYFDHNFLGLLERVTDHLADKPEHLPRHRLWKLRAKQVVLATGAIERPLVFSDNDRPGTMLASACQTYVNRYAVKPGTKAVVFTNNDGAYGAALDLAAAGVEIAAVVDLRPNPEGPATERAEAAGLPILAGHAIIGTSGGKRVSQVRIARIERRWRGHRRGGGNPRLRSVGGVRRLVPDGAPVQPIARQDPFRRRPGLFPARRPGPGDPPGRRLQRRLWVGKLLG